MLRGAAGGCHFANPARHAGAILPQPTDKRERGGNRKALAQMLHLADEMIHGELADARSRMPDASIVRSRAEVDVDEREIAGHDNPLSSKQRTDDVTLRHD